MRSLVLSCCINPHVLGIFAASHVELDPVRSDGEGTSFDLIATSNGDCEVITTTFAFDGTTYVAVDTKTDRSACD